MFNSIEAWPTSLSMEGLFISFGRRYGGKFERPFVAMKPYSTIFYSRELNYFIYFFVLLSIEPRALHAQRKYVYAEVQPLSHILGIGTLFLSYVSMLRPIEHELKRGTEGREEGETKTKEQKRKNEVKAKTGQRKPRAKKTKVRKQTSRPTNDKRAWQLVIQFI